MSSHTYVCEACGGMFTKPDSASDMVADAEFTQLFGMSREQYEAAVGPVAIICDPCYQRLELGERED